jgi:hypothetical protein
MTVTIYTTELLYNIRNKSHLEVASLPVEQRYLVEAGTEKADEIKRSVIDALSELESRLWRFLGRCGCGNAEVAEPDLEDAVAFEVKGNGRRLHGKAALIGAKILETLTDLALAKFYVSVGAANLSQAHSALAASEMMALEKMLYTKDKPTLLLG